jgi:hypothetical protein
MSLKLKRLRNSDKFSHITLLLSVTGNEDACEGKERKKTIHGCFYIPGQVLVGSSKS